MDGTRRRRRLVGRIKGTERSPWLRMLAERSEGSIVVEAAIVLPLLLLVLLSFVLFIMLCTAQMALHQTASQTARNLASYMYPAELALEGVSGNLTAAKPASSVSDPEAALPEWREVAADAAEWLPAPAGELASSALRGEWGPWIDLAATELGRGMIEPLSRKFASASALKPERVRLARLTLPDLTHKEDAYLTVALQYDFPIKMPLLGRAIILREQVKERVWVSDAAAAAYGSKIGQGDANLPRLQIVSITPTPIRPGRKATATVRTEPGQTVSLGVMYKSGASKAKHLGEATADEEGYVSWTWHVSGNTTPGIWQLTVSAARDGVETAVEKHFIVEKRSAADSEEQSMPSY